MSMSVMAINGPGPFKELRKHGPIPLTGCLPAAELAVMENLSSQVSEGDSNDGFGGRSDCRRGQARTLSVCQMDVQSPHQSQQWP